MSIPMQQAPMTAQAGKMLSITYRMPYLQQCTAMKSGWLEVFINLMRIPTIRPGQAIGMINMADIDRKQDFLSEEREVHRRRNKCFQQTIRIPTYPPKDISGVFQGSIAFCPAMQIPDSCVTSYSRDLSPRPFPDGDICRFRYSLYGKRPTESCIGQR